MRVKLLLAKNLGSNTEAVTNKVPDLRIGEETGWIETMGIMFGVRRTATETEPTTTERRDVLKA